jgi:hypothetical protein
MDNPPSNSKDRQIAVSSGRNNISVNGMELENDQILRIGLKRILSISHFRLQQRQDKDPGVEVET